MSITINNRSDIYCNQISECTDEGYNFTDPEPINYEYIVNIGVICTIRFYDNSNHQYAIRDPRTNKCSNFIVFGVDAVYEVLAFEPSAGGEYQRIKREIKTALELAITNVENLAVVK